MRKVRRALKSGWGWLASPSFALMVLVYLTLYCCVVAVAELWREPTNRALATWLGLENPFRTPLFLAGCLALLASTVACTWGRRATIGARWRGEIRGARVALPARSGRDVEGFLRANGYLLSGPSYFRNRAALWGGWVMHLGLIVLMAGALVEQSLHDSGTFTLSSGQTLNLRDRGVVFDRETGPLAPSDPPGLVLTLESFDPELRQTGYVKDRRSRLRITRPDARVTTAELDRAAGLRVGATVVYQAVPYGIALNLQLDGNTELHAVHLHWLNPSRARAVVDGPGGNRVTFWAETERPITDPAGPGRVELLLESLGATQTLVAGDVFDFDGSETRLTHLSYWSGFTYTRSVGLPAVWTGFAVLLFGCLLMAFPTGVARLGAPDGRVAAEVYTSRGGELMLADWMLDGR